MIAPKKLWNARCQAARRLSSAKILLPIWLNRLSHFRLQLGEIQRLRREIHEKIIFNLWMPLRASSIIPAGNSSKNRSTRSTCTYSKTFSNQQNNMLSSFTSEVQVHNTNKIESLMSERKVKSIGLPAFNFRDRKFSRKQAKCENSLPNFYFISVTSSHTES